MRVFKVQALVFMIPCFNQVFQLTVHLSKYIREEGLIIFDKSKNKG